MALVVLVVLVVARALWLLTQDDVPSLVEVRRREPEETSDEGPAPGPGPEPVEALSEDVTRATATPETATDGPSPNEVSRWLARNAAVAAQTVDAYCAATQRLRDRRGPLRRLHDAASFMAPRTDWEDARVGLLHLPSTVEARLRQPLSVWSAAGPDLYAGLDFSWMTALLDFDHWTVTATGPVRDLAERRSFFEAPIPNYATLHDWARLRLLKGLQENDLEQASREVRHLAALCGTSTHVGDLVGLAMLRTERAFFVEHHVGLPADSRALDADLERSAGFASIGYVLPVVDPVTRSRALACAPNRCVAIAEGLGVAASLRERLPVAVEQFEWLLQQRPCDPQLEWLARRARPMTDAELAQFAQLSFEVHMRSFLDGGHSSP